MYRQQFEKPFPFFDFNKELTLSHGGKRFVIAFDPSYINKSGKETPGLAGIGRVVQGNRNGALRLVALQPLI